MNALRQTIQHSDPIKIINMVRARAFAPRKALTVSEWADQNRMLSKKTSVEPGHWRTERNPPLQEPMDCLSSRSPVQKIVVMFPVQFGKSEILTNALGYTMEHVGGPIMVCLPGEVSMKKFINQKFNPLIDETPAVNQLLTSLKSRDASNTKDFKDYLGGQIYIEHAGSPARLKSTSARTLLVDELSAVADALDTGDDPLTMLEDRTSAYPSVHKHLYISSPGTKGQCRTEYLFQQSDQRHYHVPCPHCNELIILQWSGLHWDSHGDNVRYVCQECGCEIEEHHKTDMIKRGQWIPLNPGAKIRGYTINCLYYQIGLGPRWHTLVEMWREYSDDQAKLKTFINSRLAEAWEDPSMRAVKLNVIADRAEAYPLRTAPIGVCAITAGVDTQDNRLAVQIVGWGKGMAAWIIDYIELPGDPADDLVWQSLTQLLNTPIEHANGHQLPILATAIDAGGHRTEAVKDYVRQRQIKRPLAIFGAVQTNAPILSKPKFQEVNWRGQYDKRGVMIQHVGTVAIKHKLFSHLANDHGKPREDRQYHFSEELDRFYFAGLTSETFNPRTNRFENKRGARNEPLDTLVYAFAAAHHPEIRLNNYTKAKWDELQQKLGSVATARNTVTMATEAPRTTPIPRKSTYLQ
jgi:phage terminase large subunit GpA-like protein